MTTIITGRFQQQDQAETAMADLVHSGIPSEQVTSFFVSPHGWHRNQGAGLENTSVGAVFGATIGATAGLAFCLLCLAVFPVFRLTTILIGVGVGAYIGSLLGALSKMNNSESTRAMITEKGKPNEAPSATWGMLVANCSLVTRQRATAIEVLRSNCAADIGETDGTFAAGEWSDFDRHAPIPAIAT